MVFEADIGKKINSNAQSGIWQHILFWAASFYILNRFFSTEYGEELLAVNLIYTALFHLSLVLAVYVNLRILIPKILKKGVRTLYFSLVAILIYVTAQLNQFTFNVLADFLFPDYYFISYYEFNDLIVFVIAYLGITTLLKFSKGWFQLIENQRIMSNLEKEKSKAELSALKSQINPHFLFNSLNNLYSLALDKDKKTPEIILKLSHAMRYMLYEATDNFVPLIKEIEYLKNYLELQKLRVGERAEINFEINGNTENIFVPALIFIPFVENGFKHGIKGDIKNSFIHIELNIDQSQIVFKSENNKGEVDDPETDEYRGVGLANVKRRLELLYPNRHDLKIIDGVKTYSVELILNN